MGFWYAFVYYVPANYIPLRRGDLSGAVHLVPISHMVHRQKLLLTMLCMCVCVFSSHLSGHQVRWTYKPGSNRRKVTQDFSSRWTAMVGLFLRCLDPRRQPHRWHDGGSLYRDATSNGCNHQAGPSHRQPSLSRTRPLRSGFRRTIWRCRCSPSRRDRSSRRRRQ